MVLQYVPYVGDSKRAMDEYTSEILGGKNTIVMHNTCEDSLSHSWLLPSFWTLFFSQNLPLGSSSRPKMRFVNLGWSMISF